MAILEIGIIYQGFPLYQKKFHDIRAIQDDDIVSSSLYSMFFNLPETVLKENKKEFFLKLDMERNVMHVWKHLITEEISSEPDDIYIYMVEDRNLEDRISKQILGDVLKEFLNLYSSIIDLLSKEERPLPEFDAFVDKYVGSMSKKQYIRFFDLWDLPRMKKKD